VGIGLSRRCADASSTVQKSWRHSRSWRGTHLCSRARRRDPRHSFHINHLASHAAVDDEIGAGDEAGALAVEEPKDDLSDVLRLADAAGRVLRAILAAQCALILRLDPAGTDAVDADIRSEADREGVSERDDAPSETVENGGDRARRRFLDADVAFDEVRIR
jgi:hypothetical protein